MNHRELVLSARKKARHAFLQLPEELQDEIVCGLDDQNLTLEAASQLVKSRGFSLSHEAIAGYYRVVRRERRLVEADQEWKRVASQFASMSLEEGAQSLAKLAIARSISDLGDGSLEIKAIDLGKVLAAVSNIASSREKSRVEKREAKEGERVYPDSKNLREIKTDEDVVSALEEAVEIKLNSMLAGSGQVSLTAVKEIKTVNEFIAGMKAKLGKSDAEAGKRKGLSADAADQLRRDILGIKN